jgi:hypothetical protein
MPTIPGLTSSRCTKTWLLAVPPTGTTLSLTKMARWAVAGWAISIVFAAAAGRLFAGMAVGVVVVALDRAVSDLRKANDSPAAAIGGPVDVVTDTLAVGASLGCVDTATGGSVLNSAARSGVTDAQVKQSASSSM